MHICTVAVEVSGVKCVVAVVGGNSQRVDRGEGRSREKEKMRDLMVAQEVNMWVRS